MQIRIGTRNVILTRKFEQTIRQQLLERLERFAAAIAAVRVELSDKNGRRGGGDKRCRLQLTLVRGGQIERDDMRANLRTAIRHATSRLENAVQRQLRVVAR
jgi:putative sigma-54 modulation protein